MFMKYPFLCRPFRKLRHAWDLSLSSGLCSDLIPCCVKPSVGLQGACIFIWSPNDTLKAEVLYHPPLLNEMKTMALYTPTGFQSLWLLCLILVFASLHLAIYEVGPASYSPLETCPQ